MKKRAPLVVANWKLNGGTDLICTSVASVLSKSFKAEVGIAPPYVYISDMVNFLRNSNILVGSQNVSKFASGAFTGETSAQMLKEVGCGFCLIGHSERRQMFLENDASCHTKIERALSAGLMPILCVGENDQQHELGLTHDILYRQLHQALPGLALQEKRLCIAYEPVWAIGTGKAASAEQVQDVHQYIYQKRQCGRAIGNAQCRRSIGGGGESGPGSLCPNLHHCQRRSPVTVIALTAHCRGGHCCPPVAHLFHKDFLCKLSSRNCSAIR